MVYYTNDIDQLQNLSPSYVTSANPLGSFTDDSYLMAQPANGQAPAGDPNQIVATGHPNRIGPSVYSAPYDPSDPTQADPLGPSQDLTNQLDPSNHKRLVDAATASNAAVSPHRSLITRLLGGLGEVLGSAWNGPELESAKLHAAGINQALTGYTGEGGAADQAALLRVRALGNHDAELAANTLESQMANNQARRAGLQAQAMYHNDQIQARQEAIQTQQANRAMQNMAGELSRTPGTEARQAIIDRYRTALGPAWQYTGIPDGQDPDELAEQLGNQNSTFKATTAAADREEALKQTAPLRASATARNLHEANAPYRTQQPKNATDSERFITIMNNPNASAGEKQWASLYQSQHTKRGGAGGSGFGASPSGPSTPSATPRFSPGTVKMYPGVGQVQLHDDGHWWTMDSKRKIL